MKPLLFLIAVALLSLFGTASAQTYEGLSPKDRALKAVEVFRAQPMSERGQEAAIAVLQYGAMDPNINVSMTPKVCSWGEKLNPPPHGELLLNAYIVGNVKSQIDSGVRGSDAYAGALQV